MLNRLTYYNYYLNDGANCRAKTPNSMEAALALAALRGGGVISLERAEQIYPSTRKSQKGSTSIGGYVGQLGLAE